jgi:hypothetical protein
MRVKYNFDELWEFRDRLENFAKFDDFMKQATRELAKVLHDMLFQYTPVKTGNLCASWGGTENMAYIAKQTTDGFEVTLVNGAVNEKGEKYAVWVNDGHRSFNQYGGSYGFVKGQFFVEKSIIATEDKLEAVLFKELEKWWSWCCGGK